MNKKILFLILSGLFILILCPSGFVLAQLHSYGPDINFMDIIDSLETMAWVIFGAIAVISFLVAGILFLTAHGAPEKLQTARAAVLWGVAGVVVGIIAFSIISIIGSMFDGGYTNNSGRYNNQYNNQSQYVEPQQIQNTSPCPAGDIFISGGGTIPTGSGGFQVSGGFCIPTGLGL